MEYLDVVNKSGERLGLQKLKADVHRDGDWHKTVHVWCLNDEGEVLIQRRAADKVNFPNFWDISVAGHIDSGETAIEAALREVYEEIGANIKEGNLRYLATVPQQFVLRDGAYVDNELCVIYLLTFNRRIAELTMQEEEVAELKWISLTELKKWVEEKREDLFPHDEEYKLVFKELAI